jgi:hypothetical protein
MNIMQLFPKLPTYFITSHTKLFIMVKYLFLLFFSVSAFAQNCDMLDVHYDKTDNKSTRTIKKRFAISESGSKGFIIDFLKPGILIWSVDVIAGPSKCIESGASMKLLFEDDTRMELSSVNDFNCKGSFVVYFGGKFGNENELKILRTKKVKTMSVSTASGYHLEDLSDEVAIQLMNSIDCVSR